ncbi:MAG: MCE family protein [Solirubrobacteraceae bacterium]|nr:MCE family protein [Solirubrobacteraceae bacterium]
MSSRRRRLAANPIRSGFATLIVLIAIVAVAFTKDNPFHRPMHIGVVVQNAAGIKPGSLVRIAGVDVGSVSSVERYNGAEAAKLNLDINENGLPIHEDARVRIRPRLFLEGNFVVEISPGRPGAKRLEDGDTIPITHSTRAVQLDEVFSTLQGPERKDLQDVIQKVGEALGEEDPSDPGVTSLTRGETAGESLNDTIKAAAGAGTDIERLARALQGEQRGDLAGAIRALARATAPLADRADDLGRLIDGLDRTVSVFADNSGAVSASIAQLPQTVRTAERTLPQVRSALGPARNVAKNVADALPNTPELVRAAGPFLTQSKELLSADEGGALASSLEPISQGLASSAPSLAAILSDLDRMSVCATDALIPTANQRISDGQYTTGLTSWQEFMRSWVGFASSAQNFDANGLFARAATSQGSVFIAGAHDRVGTDGSSPILGTANSQPLSTRPLKPTAPTTTSDGAKWKFNVRCTGSMKADLNAVKSGPADGSGG